MRAFVRLLAVGLTIASMTAVSCLVLVGDVFAYGCSTPTGPNHCYNTIAWSGMTPGLNTTIENQANMFSGSTSADQISNEAWLIDTTCQSLCWVEAGFVASPNAPWNSTSPVFFWAYVKPDGTGDQRPISGLWQGLGQGSTVLSIYTANCDQQYHVFAFNALGSYTSPTWPISMNPNYIQIGTELTGQTGIGQDEFDWFDNQYAGCGSNFYYQFTDGNLSPSPPLTCGGFPYTCDPRNPPFGNWSVPPSANNPSYPGGWVYSYCC